MSRQNQVSSEFDEALLATKMAEIEAYLEVQDASLWAEGERETFLRELDNIRTGTITKKPHEVRWMTDRLGLQTAILTQIQYRELPNPPRKTLRGLQADLEDIRACIREEDTKGKDLDMLYGERILDLYRRISTYWNLLREKVRTERIGKVMQE